MGVPVNPSLFFVIFPKRAINREAFPFGDLIRCTSSAITQSNPNPNNTWAKGSRHTES